MPQPQQRPPNQRAARPNNTQQPSGAPLQQSNPGAVATALDANRFQQELDKVESRIASLIPRMVREIDSKRMLQLALRLFEDDNKIRQCSLPSILNCVMQSANLGLEFNTPKQQSWLIPYNKVCTLQIGYRGWVALAYRSGKIRNVDSRAVVEGDDFHYKYGTGEFLDHVPGERPDNFDFQRDAKYAYCLVWLKGDPTPIFTVLHRVDIERLRDQAGNLTKYDYDSGRQVHNENAIWYVWPEAMWLKTVTKARMKLLDLDPGTAEAVGIDDESEAGVTTSANLYGANIIDLTPGAERDPNADGARRTQVQGVDPGKIVTLPPEKTEWPELEDPNGIKPSNTSQQQKSNAASPTSAASAPAGNGEKLPTPAGPATIRPLTQEDFTAEQWEQLTKDFEVAGGGNVSQLHNWLATSKKQLSVEGVLKYMKERAEVERGSRAAADLNSQ